MTDTESTTTTAQAPSDTVAQDAPKATPQTPDISKLIQASEDRVRTQYSKELKAQQAIIDELRAKTMTESEIRKHKEQLLSERETTLQRKELELYAVDVLKEHEIPLNLREFIVGRDAEDTKARAGALKTEFQKAVEQAVNDRFKSGGREPAKASDSPAGKKSYSQSEIEAIAKRVQSPTMSQSERAAIMAELQAAQREGRIKN